MRTSGAHSTRSGARRATLCAVAASLGLGSGVASAAPESTRVLVKIDEAASARERQDIGTALRAAHQDALGAGWRVYELPGARTAAEVRAALAGTAADAVELDRPVLTPAAVPNDPRASEQWALDAIQAPAAWDVLVTTPVTVAVIDTGVDVTHPDLTRAVWTNAAEVPGNGLDDDGNGYVDDVNGWDFLHDDGSVFDDPVEDAHGTHVAGILAATRDDAQGIAGIAGNARIMPLKFVGGGGGLASDAIEAIRYARANGARVVNASFGGPYSQALCDAVAEAAAAGVVVVAAAGNEGIDIDTSPRVPATCPEPSVISVAASTQVDALADFSNRGVMGVDLAAPGELILSTVPGGGHETWSGTSMAAPHVAAAAALLMGQNPALSPLQVRQTILDAADRVPGLAAATVTGARLDVARTLGVAPSLTPLLAAPAAPDVPVESTETAPLARPKPRPRLLRLAASRKRFRVDRLTRLRYRVSGDARVRFTVRRASTGAVVATFVRDGSAGDNVLLLTARAGRARPLPPGRYRVAARTSSQASPPRAVTIEITPARQPRTARRR